MTSQIFLLVVLAAAAAALRYPIYSYSSPEESSDEYGPAQYKFNWYVRDEESGNNFGQEEERDDDQTQGQYYVYLPDYRKQTVTYYVDDDSGFVAEVSFDGDSRYSHETSEYEPPRRFYHFDNDDDDDDHDDDDDDHHGYKPLRRYYG
ncbi:uncharacterized protein [Panulirus ornatus]|uniref:uncharacterized protein n=1 Tax=Panulirus ornatus TaxID=150431 RepID=UPI003A88D8C2